MIKQSNRRKKKPLHGFDEMIRSLNDVDFNFT